MKSRRQEKKRKKEERGKAYGHTGQKKRGEKERDMTGEQKKDGRKEK